MLLSRVKKKVEIDRSSDENLEIDALVLFSEHVCSRNKRKTNTPRLKQKTNPPSKTVVPSIDSIFSTFFFELTADFGHVPGVRLQDLDDFSIACARTETARVAPALHLLRLNLSPHYLADQCFYFERYRGPGSRRGFAQGQSLMKSAMRRSITGARARVRSTPRSARLLS